MWNLNANVLIYQKVDVNSCATITLRRSLKFKPYSWITKLLSPLKWNGIHKHLRDIQPRRTQNSNAGNHWNNFNLALHFILPLNEIFEILVKWQSHYCLNTILQYSKHTKLKRAWTRLVWKLIKSSEAKSWMQSNRRRHSRFIE